jgi:hypothetical protein
MIEVYMINESVVQDMRMRKMKSCGWHCRAQTPARFVENGRMHAPEMAWRDLSSDFREIHTKARRKLVDCVWGWWNWEIEVTTDRDKSLDASEAFLYVFFFAQVLVIDDISSTKIFGLLLLILADPRWHWCEFSHSFDHL